MIINKPIFKIGTVFQGKNFAELCERTTQLSLPQCQQVSIYKIVRSRPRFLRSSWDYFVGTDPKNLQRFSEKKLQKFEKI